MKPREIDLQELNKQEQRLRALKERNWNNNQGFDPFTRMVITFLVGVFIAMAALIGLIVLWDKFLN